MPANWIFWAAFLIFVFAMLVLDLGVFNRKAHAVQFKEALTWTAVWIALAAVFAVLVYFFGHQMTASGRPNHVLALEFALCQNVRRIDAGPRLGVRAGALEPWAPRTGDRQAAQRQKLATRQARRDHARRYPVSGIAGMPRSAWSRSPHPS